MKRAIISSRFECRDWCEYISMYLEYYYTCRGIPSVLCTTSLIVILSINNWTTQQTFPTTFIPPDTEVHRPFDTWRGTDIIIVLACSKLTRVFAWSHYRRDPVQVQSTFASATLIMHTFFCMVVRVLTRISNSLAKVDYSPQRFVYSHKLNRCETWIVRTSMCTPI